MKTNKLVSNNQPKDWLQIVTLECSEYPIDLVNIASDELVVDVGANVGGFYKAWSHKFSNWLAVEPSKWNCELYLKNTGRSVEMNFAVWDRSGDTLKLQAYHIGKGDIPTESGSFGVMGHVYEDNKHGWKGDFEEVNTISLEDLCEKIGGVEIGLLKVDCEGAEYNFLCDKNLSQIKYIVMEMHNFLGLKNQEALLNHIKVTHSEIYTTGDGVTSHYVKLFVRNDLYRNNKILFFSKFLARINLKLKNLINK
jgi:FkbM family methyltransferase